ncbi:3-keto-disaccharide hydrolase [Ferruginibacter sp.]
MYRKKTITIISTAVVFFIYGCASSNEKNKEAWQPLFNGKDLTGWDIKIKDHSLNENYKNTFLVEDSMIRVTYAGYDKFDNQFGHLYTQTPYSCYKLKLQYRFTGNHLADAPDWADRNSGIMLHSQSAKSMELHQSFPVSLEFQFLCGNGKDTVATGSVCTPGTFINFNGKPYIEHIQKSKSKTFLKNEWVDAVAEVYGDSLIRHIINGDTVLTYTKLMIGEGFVSPEYNWATGNITDSLLWINKANTPLSQGYIALQAESQPVDFRRIEILNLVGCMDTKAKNFKSYYIKADNSKCIY